MAPTPKPGAGSSSLSPAPTASSSQAPAPTKQNQPSNETRTVKKRRVKDAPVDVKNLIPEAKVYSENVLRKMITAAIRDRQKNHDNGLAHINVVEESGIDGQVTAGYLNFHAVSDMRAYCAKPEVAKILEDLFDVRKQKFGIPNMTPGFKTETFYKFLSAANIPNSTERADIRNEVNHTDQNKYRGGAKNKTVMYANYAIACFRLLQQPSKATHGNGGFPYGGYETETSVDRFMGYLYEDWNRTIWLIKWWCNQQLPGRGTNSEKVLAAARDIAKLPRFLTSEDMGGMIEDAGISDAEDANDTIEQVRRKHQHRFYKAADALEKAMENSYLPDEIRKVMQADPATVNSREWKENAEKLEKMLISLFAPSHKSRDREGRPYIAKADALRFMEEQGRNARVLWGPDDCDAMRRQAVKDFAEKVIDVADLVEMSQALGQSTSDPSADNDNDDDGDNKQARLTWELRKMMASKSAPIPPLGESCDWAGVSPDNMTIKEAVPDLQTGEQPSYKLHQVQTAYFMRNMEKSFIQASIVALGCGLGKTLSALLMIKATNEEQVEYAKQNPNIRKTYAASLVLCPPVSVEVWQKDIDKFFPNVFQIHQFYGSEISITDPKRRETLVQPGTIGTLNDILHKLDPQDPKTGLTIVLTAHTTWYIRSLGTIGADQTIRVVPEEDQAEIAAGETSGSEDEYNDGPEALPDDEEDEDVKTEPEFDGSETDESHTRRLAHERKLKQPARGRADSLSQMERLGARKQRHRKKPQAAGSKGNQKWEEGRVYISLCDYKFARIILDEAHAIRNSRTLLSEALYQTRKDSLHCLTATALLNHATDLRGYLHQVFKPGWRLQVSTGYIDMYDEDFDATKAKGPKSIGGYQEIFDTMPLRDGSKEAETLWRAYEEGVRLFILDPYNYSSCGRIKNWSANVCAKMMPPILEMLQLRIGYETEIDLGNGTTERVGDSIPRCSFYTVQLEMNPMEKRMHDNWTLHMLASLGVGDPKSANGEDNRVAKTYAEQIGLAESAESEGVLHGGVYRYLKHGTMDPRLCILTELNHRHMTAEQKAKAAKTRKNNWTDHDIDHGASMFYCRTRDGPQYGIPTDRLTLAKYLCAFSVKMRFALGILAKNISEGEKTVMVFEYPMSLWLCETQLANLGMKFVALKSSMNQEERTKQIDAFNDPNSGVDVMLFTSALGSVSLNLQKAASRIIIMELPINFYLLIQILGRVNRIGQLSMQMVWMLWINHSFDQIALHRIFKKIVVSLAGEGAAADVEDPSVVAQLMVQVFLGLKPSHTPFHKAWATGPYTMKDQLIVDLEKAAEIPTAVDDLAMEVDGLPPSLPVAPTSESGTPLKAWVNKVTRKTVHIYPTQHIPTADALASNLAKPVSGQKRKALEDPVPENPQFPRRTWLR